MNLRSLPLAFTLVLAAWAAPSLAHADRVVLYPVAGTADQARLDAIFGTMGEILREQGHTILPPPNTERPTTSAAMQAAAGNASYVVVAEVHPLRGQYRMHLYVYYVPNGRLEDLVVTVLEAEERARLSDVLSSMVRREGLGDDVLRLTGGGPTTPPPEGETEEERLAREEAERRAQEEAERRAREAEEAARLMEEERAQREAEEAAAREAQAQRAWNERVQYGADKHWMVQLRVGGAYAVRLSPLRNAAGDDGGLLDVGLRIGRTFEGVDGFEVRGGIDIITGEFAGIVLPSGDAPAVGLTGLAVHVGAAWLGSFFVAPIFIGAGVDLGVIFPFTGARNPGFSGRLSPLVAFRPTEHIMLEASILEIGVLSPGSGVFSIGGSLRAAYRF